MLRRRPQYLDDTFEPDQHFNNVQVAKGKLQLIPLQSYRYRERWWHKIPCLTAMIVAFAIYGFLKFLDASMYYVISPYIERLWKWLFL
jgi:hypothetical protein